MQRSDLTILVTGGTGHQGGAAARYLLADGWKVRALVRHPEKPEAKRLAKAGAELIVGDLLDPLSLVPAVDGVHGVFSVETSAEAGVEGEVQEGINLADAAFHYGVEHFVYSSALGADRADAPPYFKSKKRIEQHILDLGLRATIWRPASFMENFLGHKGDILAGRIKGPTPPDEVRQFIAVDDIGRFVALAFSEHGRFVGVTREIAGDEMTMPEVAAIFSLVLDLPVVYEHVPPAEGTPAPTQAEPEPRKADLESLRELVPDLTTLESWIRRQDWGL